MIFERFKSLWLAQIASDSRLPAGALRVGIAIGHHLNRNRRDAWPGIEKLMEFTQASRATCFRAIKHLETGGHVIIKPTRRGPRSAVNNYAPILRKGRVPDKKAVSPMRLTDVTDEIQSSHACDPNFFTEPLIEPLPYGSDLASLQTTKRLCEEERGNQRPEPIPTSPTPGGVEGFSSDEVEAVQDALSNTERADVGAIVGYFRDNPHRGDVRPNVVVRILKATGLRAGQWRLTDREYNRWDDGFEQLKNSIAANRALPPKVTTKLSAPNITASSQMTT